MYRFPVGERRSPPRSASVWFRIAPGLSASSLASCTAFRIRKPRVPEILARDLRSVDSSTGTDEIVPVPLTAAVWSDAVFKRAVAPRDLVVAILGDRQAAFLCYGLAALDDETLQYLADHPSVLEQIYTLAAEPFAVFSSTLRVQDGRIVPPGSAAGSGGEAAVVLWEAVVGEPVTRPERFIAALFTLAEGRLANLYNTIGHLDPARQRFALGLWIAEPSARLDSMRALAAATIAASGDWRSMKTQPFARQPYDFSAMLMRVGVDAAGHPTSPASRAFWSQVIESPGLPDDPAMVLRTGAADTPFDAAWLAGLTTAGDIRLRAERLDQFAFGQRAFVGASPAEMPDVLVATRAFRRYRMLMVTLERMGIRKPAVYAAAARLASRLSPPDPARSFVAIAQFQGALALLWRMHGVGTLDGAAAEALVASLIAVPLNPSSQYRGGSCDGLPRISAARFLRPPLSKLPSRLPCRDPTRPPRRRASNGRDSGIESIWRRPNAVGWRACGKNSPASRWTWRSSWTPRHAR